MGTQRCQVSKSEHRCEQRTKYAIPKTTVLQCSAVSSPPLGILPAEPPPGRTVLVSLQSHINLGVGRYWRMYHLFNQLLQVQERKMEICIMKDDDYVRPNKISPVEGVFPEIVPVHVCAQRPDVRDVVAANHLAYTRLVLDLVDIREIRGLILHCYSPSSPTKYVRTH